jgi:lysozyme family protein
MNFELAFERLIGHEAGFSDDPADFGNWTGGRPGQGQLKGTKYGVSAKSYPNLDIKHLTLDDAKLLYRRDYWREDLPPALAFQFFDAAVNHGQSAAASLLQRALGIKDDGAIGPATREAIAQSNKLDLALNFMAERFEFWADARTWPAHGRGWTRRGAANLRLLAKDLK